MSVSASFIKHLVERITPGDVLLKGIETLNDAQPVVDSRWLVAPGEVGLAGSHVDTAGWRAAVMASRAVRVIG